MSTTEVIQPNLFPFPFQHHLIFCCIAMVFFVYLYVKYRKPHQLVMAIAIPLTLALWISESRMLFYAIGIIEVLMLITAFVLSIIHKKKHPELYEDEKKEKNDKGKQE